MLLQECLLLSLLFHSATVVTDCFRGRRYLPLQVSHLTTN